jgi:ElaB/YqjD/DUF883 family membrane-anchored ribosome-binding protein
MSVETATDQAAREGVNAKRAAKAAVTSAVESGQKSLNEALDAAEKGIREAAKRVEQAMREGVAALKEQAGPLRENAGQQIDEAQKYVLERVKERPVTATLAGLGVGLLLGLLLSNRSSK